MKTFIKNRNLTYLIEGALIFAGGFAYGIFAAKQKYAKRVDEEIREMRTAALSLVSVVDPKKAAESVEKDISEPVGEAEEAPPAPEVSEPYEIDAEEFGVLEGYTEQTLYYYADNDTLTDDREQIIEECSPLIGEDALDIFDDEGVDACYIRNDNTRCDYEILRCDGEFDDGGI